MENSTEVIVKEYNTPLVQAVDKRVKRVKENRELRREFMTLERKLMEERQEGEEIGKRKKQIEVALNLLPLLDNETIAQATALSVDEIKQLRKEKGI